MFWLWISYQAVKGTFTLTVIWIPLFLLWRGNGGPQQVLSDWGPFLLANAGFVLSHIILFHPRLRRRLEGMAGKGIYNAAVGIVSALTFGMALYTAIESPQTVLWSATHLLAVISVMISLAGLALVTFGVGARNPFSILGRQRDYLPEHPGIAAVTRHPVLWGIVLWSLGHLLINGTAGLVAFFLLQLIYAGIGLVMIEKRKKHSLGPEKWTELARNTSFFPNPGGLLLLLSSKNPVRKGVMIRLTLWLILSAGLIAMHPVIFGVSPLSAAGLG